MVAPVPMPEIESGMPAPSVAASPAVPLLLSTRPPIELTVTPDELPSAPVDLRINRPGSVTVPWKLFAPLNVKLPGPVKTIERALTALPSVIALLTVVSPAPKKVSVAGAETPRIELLMPPESVRPSPFDVPSEAIVAPVLSMLIKPA